MICNSVFIYSHGFPATSEKIDIHNYLICKILNSGYVLT
jgi:hypothetical protein